MGSIACAHPAPTAPCVCQGLITALLSLVSMEIVSNSNTGTDVSVSLAG